MNPVEEFFIKFTSNAKDLKKEYGDAEKASKDFEDAISKTDNKIAKLGLTFSKVALAGVAALTGAKLYEDLKKATVEAADWNFQLHRTAALTGVNARELSLWDGAIQSAGGSAGEFLGYITALNQQYAGLGINERTKNVTRNFLTLAKAWEGLTQVQKQQRATLLGITPGEILLLDQGYDKVVQILAVQAKFNNQNAETARQGNEINSILAVTDTQWKALGTDLQPVYEFIVKLGFGLATALRLITLFGKSVADLFTGDFAGLKASEDQAKQVFLDAGNYLSDPENFGKTGKAPAPTSGSADQVLPLIAKYESGNRNVLNASGPGGTPESTASGYYQIINGTWRQFAPKAGVSLAQYPTAISAPFDVQTKVASLIYQEQGLAPWASDSRLMAAAANGLGQANNSQLPAPVSVGGGSLSVGTITIHSQATNAQGIAQDIHGALHKEYDAANGSVNDGERY